MKVMILVMFFLMPDGTEKMNVVSVPKCPSEQTMTATLKQLSDEGVIKSGRAACGPVDLGRQA